MKGIGTLRKTPIWIRNHRVPNHQFSISWNYDSWESWGKIITHKYPQYRAYMGLYWIFTGFSNRQDFQTVENSKPIAALWPTKEMRFTKERVAWTRGGSGVFQVMDSGHFNGLPCCYWDVNVAMGLLHAWEWSWNISIICLLNVCLAPKKHWSSPCTSWSRMC